MKTYAIIANDQGNSFIIPTKCIFKLNSKNKAVHIDDNDVNSDKLCLRSSTYNYDNIKIIDTDDDRIRLRQKYEGEKRIVMANASLSSPQNSILIESKKTNKKGNAQQKTQPSILQKSSEYYRVMLSPNNYENNEIDRNDAGFNLDNENGEGSNDESEFERSVSDDEVEIMVERDTLETGESSSAERRALNDISNHSKSIRSPSNTLQQKSKKLNPFNKNVAKRLQLVERKINELTESLKDAQKLRNTAPQYKKILKESNVVENNEEIYLIEDTRFSPESMASILMAKTMRKKVNLMVRHLWTNEEIAKFVIRKNHHDSSLKEFSSQQIKTVRELCLHLQDKKQIQYAPGSFDDISIYLKTWLSEHFTDCRRKLKKASQG